MWSTEKRRMERIHDLLARAFTAFAPRFYEVLSIILITSGVNVLTLRVDPPTFDRLAAAGACLTLSGAALFFAAGRVESLYEVARRRAQEPRYQELTIPELARMAIQARRSRGEWRGWEFALFLVSVGALAGGIVLFGSRVIIPSRQVTPPVPAQGGGRLPKARTSTSVETMPSGGVPRVGSPQDS